MNRYLLLLLFGIGLLIVPTVTWAIPAINRKKAEPFLDAFRSAEAKYRLPSDILSRIAYQESRYNPNAVNTKSGATGLMQFMPATAKEFGIDPRDPFQSIDAAGRYMAQLYSMFKDWKIALGAYNFGPGNMRKYLAGKKALPKETQLYMTGIGKDIGIA